jgi:hypothetical protein
VVVVVRGPREDPSGAGAAAGQGREPAAFDVGGLEHVLIVTAGAPVDPALRHDLSRVIELCLRSHGAVIP